MSKKITVYDLWSQKGKRKWAQTHIDTDKEAEAAFKAGIEIISCEPDHYFPIVREVASGAFLSVGLKHGTVSSKQEAIKKGFEILEMGGDAVYCSHSIDWIEAMAKEGIPITAHVGLVPNRATWTNYRAVGKTADEALKVYQNIKDLENMVEKQIEFQYQTIICFFLISIIGVSHGALDHLKGYKLMKIYKVENKSYFYLAYIAVSLIVIFTWMIVPEIVLIIFLIVASYHFGKEDSDFLRLKKVKYFLFR